MQSGFLLVLPEKSDSRFPVVNPAYEANLVFPECAPELFDTPVYCHLVGKDWQLLENQTTHLLDRQDDI